MAIGFSNEDTEYLKKLRKTAKKRRNVDMYTYGALGLIMVGIGITYLFLGSLFWFILGLVWLSISALDFYIVKLAFETYKARSIHEGFWQLDELDKQNKIG